MKQKLWIYFLPALLVSMVLYGYNVQDLPSNFDQSTNSQQLISNTDNSPVIPPSVEGACAQTWTIQPSGSTTNQYLTVSAVSSQICWTAGATTTSGGVPIVRRTINGGTTWTDATGTGLSGAVYNIWGIDANTALCTTSPSATNIYRTVNGGGTWTVVFTLAGGFMDGIQMVSPTEGYAMGDPVGGKWVVIKTTDGGATWARMATEPVQVGGEFGYNNSFMILGTNIWFGTNVNTVYHSTNLGLTWSFAAGGLGSADVTELHFNSAGAAGAGLISDGLSSAKTVNGGTSFTATGTPGFLSGVGGLEGDGNEWWAARLDSVYISVNQGATWTYVHDHTTATAFQDMDFVNESGCPVGWVVGNSGAISKMSPAFTKTLQLTALIEGFVSCSPTFINIGDTLTVELRSGVSPYPIIDVAKGKTDGNGNVTVSFTAAIADATPYYIVVRHRNSIETWSMTGGIIWPAAVTTISYDFTTAASQAFGNNQVAKCSEFAIFGGDVNQSGQVNLTDIVLVSNGATSFSNGYVVTDLNGDNITNLGDILIAFNNSNLFVTRKFPV